MIIEFPLIKFIDTLDVASCFDKYDICTFLIVRDRSADFEYRISARYFANLIPKPRNGTTSQSRTPLAELYSLAMKKVD